MADLPILFSAPMVRAILREIEQPGTGKTQTRRVLDMPPMSFDAVFNDDGVWHIGDAATGHRYAKLSVRYRVGDRLYVREAWRVSHKHDATAPRDVKPRTMTVMFDAGGSIANHPTGGWVDGFFVDIQEWRPDKWPPVGDTIEWAGRFRQGMHLPRWASRLTLEVTEVRVQRLQDISEADAIAEGLEHDIDGDVDGDGRHVVIESWRGADYLPWLRDPIEAYADLWDQLNNARGYGWDANPWVAVYTFRPVLGNIDQIGGGDD